jgi:hypothetical protein
VCELGATAARRLDERISGRTAIPARHEALPTRLVIRASRGANDN